MSHILKRLLFSVLSCMPLALSANARPSNTEVVARVMPTVVCIIGEINFFDQYLGDLGVWCDTLRPFYNYLWPSQK